jgi:hypothetical protein
MKLHSLLLSLLAALLLAGCNIEPAGYLIDGGDHSLTLERSKPYFWSDGWELNLVVANYPDCQRRFQLKKASDKKFRIDLYRTQPNIFIINQGKNWYVAEARECRMQEYEEEPPEPGEFLGSFREKKGEFAFFPYEADK